MSCCEGISNMDAQWVALKKKNCLLLHQKITNSFKCKHTSLEGKRFRPFTHYVYSHNLGSISQLRSSLITSLIPIKSDIPWHFDISIFYIIVVCPHSNGRKWDLNVQWNIFYGSVLPYLYLWICQCIMLSETNFHINLLKLWVSIDLPLQRPEV